MIEVQTGSDVDSGDHRFQIESVSWSGPIIRQATLYRALVVIWVSAIVLVLLIRVVTLNITLQKNARYQAELQKINGLLNVKNRKFEELAKTDGLTGVANRLGVRELLYRSLSDWRAKRTPLSLIMVDIDHFKTTWIQLISAIDYAASRSAVCPHKTSFGVFQPNVSLGRLFSLSITN